MISRSGCFKKEPPAMATARAGWRSIRQPRGHSPKSAATVLLGFGPPACCLMRTQPPRASVSLRWDDGDVGATISRCSSRWTSPCSGHMNSHSQCFVQRLLPRSRLRGSRRPVCFSFPLPASLRSCLSAIIKSPRCLKGDVRNSSCFSLPAGVGCTEGRSEVCHTSALL